MASQVYRLRIWLFLVSVLIPAAVYGFLGSVLYRQEQLLLKHAAVQQQQPPQLDLRFAFYTAGIILALAVTLFCRYVVWQDFRREARAADMRTEFVARVSHELRTPLTSIRLLAETLSLGRVTEPERQREYLNNITQESERLATLVDNVMSFAKAGAASRDGFTRVELRPLIDSVLAQLHPILDAREFQVSIWCVSEGLAVRGDSEALRQAILNLLTNALKYSGDSRKIEVRLNREGTGARLEVADWGIGVPPEFRAKIFQRFYRAPRAGSDNVSGVGLGLALVAEVVRTHGGRVDLRDNDPRGTIFSLILPMAKA
jgi:two-component system phosphate regulon sensor histidine kinase PhoR